MVDVVRRAGDAVDRRDWLMAYQQLSAAEDNSLRAADFVDLATAAYLLARREDCVAALQRAHQAYLAGRDVEAAVRTAFWLSLVLRQSGERAVANGWINRAERLAADLPEDCVEHGYVEFALLMRDVFSGKGDVTTRRPAVVVDYGRRFADPNLIAAGLMSSGRRAIYAGQVAEGLAYLDEAIVCLLSGGLSPIIAGMVLCSAIDACQELWEIRRVAEWTAALDTWCDNQQGLEMFTGTCCLHKGQVLAARGAFTAAVPEFAEAITRFLTGTGSARAIGTALAEMADALRARGDLDQASDALRRAAVHGWDPLPQQALLDLASGRRKSAVAAARRLLAEKQPPIQRAQRLARVVDVLLATGDHTAAGDAIEEMSQLAQQIGTPVFGAHAARARGALALTRGSTAAAAVELRTALSSFLAAGSSYEAARTRLMLANALDKAGDPDAAHRERDIATTALADMGITAPVETTEPLTERQTEVLRLVAAGRSNREIARDLHLSEKTVARHLSNIFLALGVTSRTAAAAYGYEHDIIRRASHADELEPRNV